MTLEQGMCNRMLKFSIQQRKLFYLGELCYFGLYTMNVLWFAINISLISSSVYTLVAEFVISPAWLISDTLIHSTGKESSADNSGQWILQKFCYGCYPFCIHPWISLCNFVLVILWSLNAGWNKNKRKQRLSSGTRQSGKAIKYCHVYRVWVCSVVWLITIRGFGLDTGFIHYGDL
jgi:hypothetical protein